MAGDVRAYILECIPYAVRKGNKYFLTHDRCLQIATCKLEDPTAGLRKLFDHFPTLGATFCDPGKASRNQLGEGILRGQWCFYHLIPW